MKTNAYAIFKVEEQFYALSAGVVKQIIRSVQLTYLHKAPELLLGLVNMKGEIIPVMNIRKQFQVNEREISLLDRIIIAEASPHTIAFVVDSIEGIIELLESDITPAKNIYPPMEDYISGTAKYEDHTILIYDVNSLFPKSEIEKIATHLENSEKM